MTTEEIKKCIVCGGEKTMHTVGSNRMCCECYVKAGNPPSDWHPQCLKTFQILKQLV